MKRLEAIEINGIRICELIADGVAISDAQDALDMMADCSSIGSKKIIVLEKNIIPGFFDLSTGIAGEILQKFSTYGVQLAIVGDYAKFPSKSLRDFIFESNKAGRIYFVGTVAEAKQRLSAM
ncbi:MAG TPA: DUF4180 domain-containing protein [Mucilaginibacter sp.]|nr:DUF4180 domain-containing protein [Mucilaginibacter sp.]